MSPQHPFPLEESRQNLSHTALSSSGGGQKPLVFLSRDSITPASVCVFTHLLYMCLYLRPPVPSKDTRPWIQAVVMVV